MDGIDILLVVMCSAIAIYVGWLLRKGLKAGILESPQGWRTHRATHPLLFKVGASAYAVVILLCLAMIVMIVFGLHE